MKTYDDLRNLLAVLVIGVLFLLVSYVMQENAEALKLWVLEQPFFTGIFIYVVLNFLTTVVAPLSSLPLVPVGASLWGWQVTGLLNLLSWGLGSFVAFYIATKYGKPLVKRLVSLEKLERLEKRIPQDNLFWTVIFLRIVIPVDLLSYALGIFTKMKIRDYALATMIGIAPFSFIFAYAGELSFRNQIITFFAFFALLSLGLLVKNLIFQKKNTGLK